MPRNISFFYTQPQVRNRTKTVTRRLGWEFLEGGEILNACVKCQGLKKGEKIVRMCQIRVVDVRRERLYSDLTKEDVVCEGFPELNKAQFVDMFRVRMKCAFNIMVTRIEFEYLN